MMEPPNTMMLLQDAIDQLALDPSASFRWHTLVDLFNNDPTPQRRDFVCEALERRLPAGQVAGFMRATLLADMRRQPADLQEAARLLLALTPVDVDRVMAFANFQAGRATVAHQGHRVFCQTLRMAALPELLRSAGEQLGAAGGIARRPVEAVRKVALVMPNIGDLWHPPTEMGLQQAFLLRELGFEVAVFSCQEQQQPNMHHYLSTNEPVVSVPLRAEGLDARLPPGVQASVADPRLSMMGRWQGMLGQIGDFDPDLVMLVGFGSPLMFPLYRARPVLGLNVHALPLMAPVDAWLTADPARAGQDSSDWGESIPPAHGHYHPYRVALKPAPAALKRSALRLPEQALVLLTVGARLGDEIHGPWAQRMLELLKRHPQVVWLLVGGNGALPPALKAAAPGSVVSLAYRGDLRAVNRCCDLYVNPPRVGGGLSVAEAMAEGVPVLALTDGDAGNKVGPMAMASEDIMFDTLEQLIDSPERRAALGEAMRLRFRCELDLAQSHESLRAACALAIERFAARA